MKKRALSEPAQHYFGLNTFCIALQSINMDNFNYFNYKIIKKNNKFSLMDKHYRQFP